MLDTKVKLSTHPNRLRNKILLLCILIMGAVLSLTYLFEYFVGNRSKGYIVLYLVVVLITCVLTYICYYFYKDTSRSFVLLALTVFNIMYMYSMVTSYYTITFCYILPLISVTMLWYKTKIPLLISGIATLEVIVSTLLRFFLNVPIDVTQTEIAIICMVLVTINIGLGQLGILRNIEDYDTLYSSLMSDTLTGCRTRYFLNDLIDSGFFAQHDAIVVLCDIDHFKKFNDTWGHQCGDVVLKNVSQSLIDICNKYPNTDVVRIGGDEFVIVTTSPYYLDFITEFEELCYYAHKYAGVTEPVSLSYGISYSDNNSKSYDTLYQEADECMYRMKESHHAKRNQTVIS